MLYILEAWNKRIYIYVKTTRNYIGNNKRKLRWQQQSQQLQQQQALLAVENSSQESPEAPVLVHEMIGLVNSDNEQNSMTCQ